MCHPPTNGARRRTLLAVAPTHRGGDRGGLCPVDPGRERRRQHDDHRHCTIHGRHRDPAARPAPAFAGLLSTTGNEPNERRGKQSIRVRPECRCTRSIHCLLNPSVQSIEDWAPTNITHTGQVFFFTPKKKTRPAHRAIKALETCNVRFEGPTFVHQRDTATVVQHAGRRLGVAHRLQTVLRPRGCEPTTDNWPRLPPILWLACASPGRSSRHSHSTTRATSQSTSRSPGRTRLRDTTLVPRWFSRR